MWYDITPKQAKLESEIAYCSYGRIRRCEKLLGVVFEVYLKPNPHLEQLSDLDLTLILSKLERTMFTLVPYEVAI